MLLIQSPEIPDGYETSCRPEAFEKQQDGSVKMVVPPLGSEDGELLTHLPSCGLRHRSFGNEGWIRLEDLPEGWTPPSDRMVLRQPEGPT